MTTPPRIKGIHHLKFPVAELDRSLRFYEEVFGAKRITALDHKHPDGTLYAYILEVPNLGAYLELRLNPAQARQQQGFDPVTIAVEDRAALEAWGQHLDAVRITHSPVITGLVGWLMVFDDPDGRRLSLYSLATHGPEAQPDVDSPWLKPAERA